jgi:hypothetical protein
MVVHVSAAANALVNLWDTRRIIAKGDSFQADTDLRFATMVSIQRHLKAPSSVNMVIFFVIGCYWYAWPIARCVL